MSLPVGVWVVRDSCRTTGRDVRCRRVRAMDDADKTAALFQALDEFEELLARKEVQGRWSEPSAMEGFSVGALVLHTIIAAGRTLTMLDTASDNGHGVLLAADYIGSFKPSATRPSSGIAGVTTTRSCDWPLSYERHSQRRPRRWKRGEGDRRRGRPTWMAGRG
jgi:hypothetical protein